MTGRLLYLYFRVTNCAMFVRKKLEFRVSVSRVSVGGAMLWHRTGDQELASWIPGQGAAAYDDSGQVVHIQLPRSWHSSLEA